VRYFPFALDEEENVVSEQLELDTVLEPALSRLGFVVDLEVLVSRRFFFYRFPKQGEENKRKTNWRGHVLGITLTTGAQATSTSGLCILTTTGNFFAPKMTSLKGYGSSSVYKCRCEFVESRGVYHHVQVIRLEVMSVRRSLLAGTYFLSASRKNINTGREPHKVAQKLREGEK
jgi:hypothetical protein